MEPSDAKATINPKSAVDYLTSAMQTYHVKKTTQYLTPNEQSFPAPDITLTTGASSFIGLYE
ncbi:hypothetical protein DPMN_066496 [Dreissena polymorpha]|uniref:Uncharacterized protein n=1 Tax=Dreissena polymorpha TaxID=45954 RepID=A0A9D3YTL2_DREPO|nr:hypothetical protein DPMN_066496 [Dreissena polymorpha]